MASRSPRRSRSRSRSYASPPRRYRSRSRSPSLTDEERCRIHISDLGLETTEKDLEKMFDKFGRIKDMWLAKTPPCFAFVVFESKLSAEDAIKEMHGTWVNGDRIRVTVAKPRRRGRGFWHPNMRCYQCGDKGHFSRDCDGTGGFRSSFRKEFEERERRRGGGYGGRDYGGGGYRGDRYGGGRYDDRGGRGGYSRGYERFRPSYSRSRSRSRGPPRGGGGGRPASRSPRFRSRSRSY